MLISFNNFNIQSCKNKKIFSDYYLICSILKINKAKDFTGCFTTTYIIIEHELLFDKHELLFDKFGIVINNWRFGRL